MLPIFILIGLFIMSDIILDKKYNIKGSYYINHFICNMMVVYNTFDCMISSYTEPTYSNICNVDSLYFAKYTIYALHLYHMIWYYNKLRYDDWIHHIIMVGISLPLTELIDNYNLIGHCLFFTTGLPGGIDYFLLALVRNNIIDKGIEKRINKNINLWIRCPGCISNVTLSIFSLIYLYEVTTNINIIASIIIILSVYWNGIYFMEQVVSDYIKYSMSIESIDRKT